MTSQTVDSNSVATPVAAAQQQQTTDKPARVLPFSLSTSEDDTVSAGETWAAAFANDPVLRWLQHHRSKPNLIYDTAFTRQSFILIAGMFQANQGCLVNVDGAWGCVGVHFPPGTSPDSFLRMLLGISLSDMLSVLWKLGCERSYRNLITYNQKLHALKQNYFTKERLKHNNYYAIGMLATLKEVRGQGLASAYVRLVQGQARRQGVPVWLETSTEHAKAIYERCGFRVVECLRLGKGQVNQEGWAVRKGQEGEGDGAVGAPLWGMIWWPEGVGEERKT